MCVLGFQDFTSDPLRPLSSESTEPPVVDTKFQVTTSEIFYLLRLQSTWVRWVWNSHWNTKVPILHRRAVIHRLYHQWKIFLLNWILNTDETEIVEMDTSAISSVPVCTDDSWTLPRPGLIVKILNRVFFLTLYRAVIKKYIQYITLLIKVMSSNLLYIII